MIDPAAEPKETWAACIAAIRLNAAERLPGPTPKALSAGMR